MPGNTALVVTGVIELSRSDVSLSDDTGYAVAVLIKLTLVGLAAGLTLFHQLTAKTASPASRGIVQGLILVTSLGIVAAAVALVLGTVGVYGVISYAVSQRTQEIGIRMALGATAADIKRLGLRHGLVIALSGGVLGLILSVVLGRTIEAVLYGVSPSDPFSVAVIATVLGGVVLLASYVPARRATRVEPTTALRAE